jgi:hypothetical protein
MKNQSISSALTPIVKVVSRYYLTIFIIITASGLAAAVLTLNSILLSASDTSHYTSTATTPVYDQATADKVEALYTSSNSPATYALPTGRVNPFSE